VVQTQETFHSGEDSGFLECDAIQLRGGGTDALFTQAYITKQTGALLRGGTFGGGLPLLLDLKTVRPDFDHVVALFNERGCWGAISKTNHPVLRYRDPVYKSIRELAMSYFHEYFLNSGKKTLRQYSKPFDLSKLGTGWITTEENLATLAHELDISKHFKILTLKQVRNLRKAEGIEIKASNLTEWKRK